MAPAHVAPTLFGSGCVPGAQENEPHAALSPQHKLLSAAVQDAVAHGDALFAAFLTLPGKQVWVKQSALLVQHKSLSAAAVQVFAAHNCVELLKSAWVPGEQVYVEHSRLFSQHNASSAGDTHAAAAHGDALFAAFG